MEGDVVDARRVGDGLPPRLRLHVLLEPGVEVADDGADAGDRLAVQVDDEPQHAVGRGVVRAEVDPQDVVEPVPLGIDLEDRRHGMRDPGPLVDARRRGGRSSVLVREADGLAAERVVLAEREPSQSSGMRMRTRFPWPSKRMPSMSQASRSNQSAAGQTGNTLAIGSPSSSQACTRTRAGSSATREQVVRDREALRLRVGDAREPAEPGLVQVAARGGPDVARHLLLAPAEVVGGGDVAQEVEAVLVAEHGASLDEPGRVDDERRLAERLPRLDKSGNAGVGAHSATPRISYAGGTPPRIFSCRRMMPSISASGRGGQPGTWMSTGTILSTPWRIV